MAKTCRGCVYYRSLSENSPNLQHYCNYLLDTGNTRDCPAESCDKKLTKEEAMKRKRLTEEDKREIVRLRKCEKMSPSSIAEKFGIARQTVLNIVCEWKEFVDVDTDITDELHDKDVNDAAGRNEKKPDTAATVTDSKQENTCENIPADIIPDNSENVKTDDLLPCAVVDAIADQIDRLFDKIAECDRKAQEIQTARANAENDLNELKAFLRKNGYVEIVKMLASNAEWRALTNESPNSM